MRNTPIIWGEDDSWIDDTWIPVDRPHTLEHLIPTSELHLIPDAGHLIQLDAPEQLVATLIGWLASLQ